MREGNVPLFLTCTRVRGREGEKEERLGERMESRKRRRIEEVEIEQEKRENVGREGEQSENGGGERNYPPPPYALAWRRNLARERERDGERKTFLLPPFLATEAISVARREEREERGRGGRKGEKDRERRCRGREKKEKERER